MRLILILLALLLLVSPVLAQSGSWTLAWDGCEDGGLYRFEIHNRGGGLLTGHWYDGARTETLRLREGQSKTVITPGYFFQVYSNKGYKAVSLPAEDCALIPAQADTPAPAYLIAAPGVPGPATWVCNGYAIVGDDKLPLTTPGEVFVWRGERVPVTVLILSTYQHPADCRVEGAAPAWYADFERWTCLAYQGDDGGCGGATDFH